MSNSPPAWPLVPDYRADLFAGTAEYYARYRPPYPPALVDDLRIRADIDGTARLLDLGCGTGQVALALAPFVDAICAVDQEPEMVAVGRRKAEELGVTNVQWVVGRAEEFEAPVGRFTLIAIGNAFHRLNRPLIATKALGWLATGGTLAIVGSSVGWKGEEEWQAVARRVIHKWLPAKGSGSAVTEHNRTHEEVLRASGFQAVEERIYQIPHVWTLESFVGFLYSTSVSSKTALGDDAEAFEAELTRALLDHDPRGEYTENVTFFALLAKVGKLAR